MFYVDLKKEVRGVQIRIITVFLASLAVREFKLDCFWNVALET